VLGPGFKPGERQFLSLVGSTPTGFRQLNGLASRPDRFA